LENIGYVAHMPVCQMGQLTVVYVYD